MTKITIKKVRMSTFVKWHVLSSVIGGFFVGVAYSAIGYVSSGGNLKGYLFWYVLGFPVLYLFMGLFTGVIFSAVYNGYSNLLGGFQFEIDTETLESSNPPPPPQEW
jgi:formate-dependent nitrite reductase membrane component NrfD